MAAQLAHQVWSAPLAEFHPDKQAAIEYQRRRLARRNLLDFTLYTFPAFEVARHHLALCQALDAVLNGTVKRLMLCLPPRHTKSEFASKRFPALFLGRNPGQQVLTASYAGDLAVNFGREVRNLIASPEYQTLFPGIALAIDRKAAGNWRTNREGVYVASGVGGAATGYGGHLIIIDDPFKNRAEADSLVRRELVWSWYRSTIYPRRMPDAAVVLICTRWHDDDLAGRLLAEQEHGGDQWLTVSLPAIAGEGTGQEEALWPEWFPLEELHKTRTVIGPREWSALYQQRPQPETGAYFQRPWFELYEPHQLPRRLRIYGASDYAVTQDGGDYTEHGTIGADERDDLWVLDWWHGQESTDVWIDRQLDLVRAHKPACWFGEAGVIQLAIEPFLAKRMTERRDYVLMEWLTSITDKATRARAIQARAAQGKLHLPNNPMGLRLLDQLLRFPAGRYDDAVDVLGLIGRGLEHVQAASRDRAAPPAPSREDKYKRRQSGAPPNWRIA